MFADDIVVFLKPNEVDLKMCSRILQIFGEVASLKVNMVRR